MKWIMAAVVTCPPICAGAQSFHDPVPEEFRGTFAPTLADCQGENGVEIIDVRADGIHYFEGDDYLIIGVKFQGSSTKSRRFVPLFNGRFTGRMETQLLGEARARMEMETPDTLIRYMLKDDGEVDPKPVNIWVRWRRCRRPLASRNVGVSRFVEPSNRRVFCSLHATPPSDRGRRAESQPQGAVRPRHHPRAFR